MTGTFSQYRGQWGGKISNGEEMWWSEPNARLTSSAWARFWFGIDVRQHFILRFLKNALRSCSSADPMIVDLGCGTGGTTLNFSAYLQKPLIGLDIFETQLEIARQFAAAQGSRSTFRRLEADGRFPLTDATVDVMTSLDVLGHVPDIPKVLAECRRVLKPGGSLVLFTEASFSPSDPSIGARMARQGIDMTTAVPEHISLFPRETLEQMFGQADFEIRERYSANVGHFFFFPKDYVLMLRGKKAFRGLYVLAWVWNRISKVTPFYPWPFQLLRLLWTYLRGHDAYGTGYFYHLVRK